MPLSASIVSASSDSVAGPIVQTILVWHAPPPAPVLYVCVDIWCVCVCVQQKKECVVACPLLTRREAGAREQRAGAPPRERRSKTKTPLAHRQGATAAARPARPRAARLQMEALTWLPTRHCCRAAAELLPKGLLLLVLPGAAPGRALLLPAFESNTALSARQIRVYEDDGVLPYDPSAGSAAALCL